MPEIILNIPDRDGWQSLAEVPIPHWVPVRQKFDATREEDVAGAVRRELARPDIQEHLQPGKSVAIGVGSRGLASLREIVAATVTVLKEAGCEPFIIPAMGSHGGATAQGQIATLAELGVTETTAGAPMRSSMEVVEVGRLPGGTPLYFDRLAMQADLVIPINRIKPHTSFHGQIESGLVKMLAIGLGKHAGAVALHAEGFDGMSERLCEALPILQANTPFSFGLATVENAYHEVAQVEAIPSNRLLERETALLGQARRCMARLLFDELDVLVIREIGKDVSGTGMDPNVTGRSATGASGTIHVNRIVVLDLTAHTAGNATGLGMADVTTERVVRALDLHATWINALTSTNLPSSRIPIFMPNDRLAIAAALKTCGKSDPAQARVAWVQNTLSLDAIRISEPLWKEIADRPEFTQAGEPSQLPFDHEGNLVWQ
jgi:hypothetical protein